MRALYMHLIITSISSMTFIGLFTTRSYRFILPSSSTASQLPGFFRFSLKGLEEVLVSYCGLSWLQLTAKLLTVSTLPINIPQSWEIYFGNNNKKNPKQPAPNPSKITKTLTFIHTQILSQLLKHFCKLLKATKILYSFLVQCKLDFYIDWGPQIFNSHV